MRTRFVSPIELSKLHIVAKMRCTLRIVRRVGSSIIVHDVSVTTCTSRWVVDGPSVPSQQGALIVLMDHVLILFITPYTVRSLNSI